MDSVSFLEVLLQQAVVLQPFFILSYWLQHQSNINEGNTYNLYV